MKVPECGCGSEKLTDRLRDSPYQSRSSYLTTSIISQLEKTGCIIEVIGQIVKLEA